MRSIGLKEIDARILAQLREDAGLSSAVLAERVGLSTAAYVRRVQALEKAGVIKKYTALVDPRVADLGVTVFVQVRFDWHVKERLDLFEKTILEQPEVLECYLLTGDADYLLRVMVPDVATYERFLVERLRRLPGLAHLESGFALRQVKNSRTVPVPASPKTTRRPPRRQRTKANASRSAL
jgi:Lrp/AsnC family transcriptional regulator, leucine-responsive regulatory protein